MTALLAFLTSSLGQWLIGAGAVIATVLAGYAKGHMNGAAAERQKQSAKERDAYAKDLRDLEDAARAGAAIDDSGMQHDPYNRDKR